MNPPGRARPAGALELARSLVGAAQSALRLSPFSAMGLGLPAHTSNRPTARPRAFRCVRGFRLLLRSLPLASSCVSSICSSSAAPVERPRITLGARPGGSPVHPARREQALPPGGTLLLAEPMSGTRVAESIGDAYFGLYLGPWGAVARAPPRGSKPCCGRLDSIESGRCGRADLCSRVS